MGHNVKQALMSSRIDFFYYIFRNILLVSIPLAIVSAFILGFNMPHGSARISSSDNLAISVPSSCTLSSSVDEAHSASIVNGRYEEGIGTTTLSTFCNDKNGYSIYAIGDSLNSEGNNTLVGSNGSNINSGTATSGDTSNWAMKLALKAGDTSTTPPTIISPFNSYSTVPTTWTKVATIPSSTTDMEKGSNFTTTYATYISPTQAAGTYLGQVKYLLTHPSAATPTSAYIMQEVANWEDELPNPDDSIQAIDIRDGKQYWVTRLADGHIWMTSNLDLDIGGTNVAALTSENTDISTAASGSGIYSAGYTEQDGVWTWTPASTAITSNYYIDNTTVKPSAWPTNNYTTPYSAEGGDTYYYTSNTTGNDARYNSLQACKDASHTEDECKRYFAGNYYNWSAAIASNNSTNISTTGTIASNSICPKGWRLPNASQTDNEYNEFGIMFYKAGITLNLSNGNSSVGYKDGITSFNQLRSNPYYFVRSGSITGSTIVNSGFSGNYWSSTVSGSTHIYGLYIDGNGLYPANNSNRSYGRPIRCLAR